MKVIQEEEAMKTHEKASTQLKSILGVLNSKTSVKQLPAPWASGSTADEVRIEKKSLKDIQDEQKLVSEANREKSSAVGTILTSGFKGSSNLPLQWSKGSENSSKMQVLSLREIMQQEEVTQLQSPKSNTISQSTWAAKAGTNVRGNLSATHSRVASDHLMSTKTTQSDVAVTNSSHSVVTVSEKKSKEKSKTKTAGGGTPSDGFVAGKFSREFADWCSNQLVKIKGNDGNEDLTTLVQLCLSLESAADIREYLAIYLGSTPQVQTVRIILHYK